MSDIYRNLVKAALDSATWITRNDESRNAIFGYSLGRLSNVGGTANAITADLLHGQGFTALQDGALMWIVPTADNTGPATIDIGGIGAVAIRDSSDAALTGGELVTGRATLLSYSSSTGHIHVMLTVPAASGILGIQLITATGTYVPTSGTEKALVICQAPGAGGGYANNSNNSGSIRAAGCGAAGETRAGVVSITGNVSVTIGSPGTGGVYGSINGTDGGDVVFGSDITAKGGLKGTGSVDVYGGGGTDGTTPTGTGGIRIPPRRVAKNAYSAGASLLGHGGSSWFGDGGYQPIVNAKGKDGEGYGGGGAGGSDLSSGSGDGGFNGGAGAPGMIIVIEFGTA